MTKEQGQEPVKPAEMQNLWIDLQRTMPIPFGMGRFGDNATSGFNKTHFEGYDLNTMVDMVDQSNPSDLEEVGAALEQAAKKIEDVGVDLGKHIGEVTWEGQAGDAFRIWGNDLAKNTKKLADYTSTASVQVKAAGMGLATVKKGMPPRDDGGVGPAVAKIPEAERTKDNKEYQQAKQSDAQAYEKKRQEAINEMNKLSSYYQVSHDTLYAQEEPVFKPMPTSKIGMPPPPRTIGDTPGGDGVVPTPASTGADVSPLTTSKTTSPTFTSSNGHVSLPTQQGITSPAPEQPIHTEIDSIAPPPAPPVDPGLRAPSPVPHGPGPTGPTVVGPTPTSPAPRPGSGKYTGTTGPVRGGQGTPYGNRPPVTGGGGQPTTPRQTTPVGRPPVTGQSPIAGRPVPTAPPRPGQVPGVVGGMPSQTGTTSGAPRIPRGTVIGAEQTMMGRPPMMGMMGARGAGAPGGMTGDPRTMNGAGRSTARAFTPGGTGLTRGGENSRSGVGMAPRTQTPTSRDEERNDSRRPDYLVEDEETWSRGRNDVAPPVIE